MRVPLQIRLKKDFEKANYRYLVFNTRRFGNKIFTVYVQFLFRGKTPVYHTSASIENYIEIIISCMFVNVHVRV